jgi:hypothetical protein
MTTKPSPFRTVTDKLVEQALRRLTKRLEVEYESCCPYRSARSGWFEQLDRAEAKLHELFAPRPLNKAAIASASERAWKSLRATLREEKRAQPRFQEVVNISTGAVHLIPHSGD